MINHLATLRVKIKSLAEEAKIIRHEQSKYWGASETYQSLDYHRRWIVRSESRCSQLAYGFLLERPYLSLEAKCYTIPDWVKVAKIIVRFSSGNNLLETQAKLEVWYKTPVALTLAS